MKRVLILILCVLFALSLLAGCGQKQEGTKTETTAAGKPEEMADSTRMDSAQMESAKTDTAQMTPGDTAQPAGGH
jgi:hypothetical protein